MGTKGDPDANGGLGIRQGTMDRKTLHAYCMPSVARECNNSGAGIFHLEEQIVNHRRV